MKIKTLSTFERREINFEKPIEIFIADSMSVNTTVTEQLIAVITTEGTAKSKNLMLINQGRKVSEEHNKDLYDLIETNLLS